MMTSSGAEDRATHAARRSAQILVVEDELYIRMFISEAFRDEGYEVIEAHNGDEAVDILKAGKSFDLVFSDVRMPGTTDGIGLLRFVKEQFAGLPVILTSGHLHPGDATVVGARHLLTKPYCLAAVLDLVAAELATPA